MEQVWEILKEIGAFFTGFADAVTSVVAFFGKILIWIFEKLAALIKLGIDALK